MCQTVMVTRKVDLFSGIVKNDRSCADNYGHFIYIKKLWAACPVLNANRVSSVSLL